MTDDIVSLAQRMGNAVRTVGEALLSPRPANGLARYQIRMLREMLDRAERELDRRETAGDDASRIVASIARAVRGWSGIAATGDVHIAAYLANALETAARIAAGHTPRTTYAKDAPEAEFDPMQHEALQLVMRVHGIGAVAMTLFAANFPEHAAKIDRASLDRLVTAWLAPTDGGKWPAIADVWRRRIGRKVAAQSIKIELAKGRRRNASNFPAARG